MPGALAGAGDLYTGDGTEVNPGANQTASDIATVNYSQKYPVDAYEIQRGHWSLQPVLLPPTIHYYRSTCGMHPQEELDANPDFINAVKVRVKTQSVIAWFFLRSGTHPHLRQRGSRGIHRVFRKLAPRRCRSTYCNLHAVCC